MRALSQVEFSRLVIRLTPDKDTIQKRLANGHTSTELAATYKIGVTTFADVCRVLDITRPGRGGDQGRKVAPVLIADLLTVVRRLAEEMSVNYDEIKGYLQEAPVAAGEAR